MIMHLVSESFLTVDIVKKEKDKQNSEISYSVIRTNFSHKPTDKLLD